MAQFLNTIKVFFQKFFTYPTSDIFVREKKCHYFGKCHYLGFHYYDWLSMVSHPWTIGTGSKILAFRLRCQSLIKQWRITKLGQSRGVKFWGCDRVFEQEVRLNFFSMSYNLMVVFQFMNNKVVISSFSLKLLMKTNRRQLF